MNRKKVVAIIPARGGSKGIPLKNLKLLGKKPLIAWPIETAMKIKLINRVIVSTEDENIAQVAKNFGAEVPFLRPKELALDETPTLPVLQHTLSYLKQQESWQADIILLLYPTSPFIQANRIIQALEIFDTTNCASVLGVQKDAGRFWQYDQKLNRYQPFYPKNRVNRQFYQPLIREAGNIYFSKYEVIMEKKTLIDKTNTEFIFIDETETIDIDTIVDWQKAEAYIKSQ